MGLPGKSTIVRLTSHMLSQAKGWDHRIAEFDIWSHQDDPLRRTFLESLITRLQGFGWVDKTKWDRRRAEIARRRREDKTRVVPTLTSAGRWFALTLLFVPFGAALVSAGATLMASQHASLTLAIAILVAGFVAALSPAIFYGALRCRRKRPDSVRSEQGDSLNDVPALVTGQATTETSTTVTQTPDPTSVEFESVFRELLKEALSDENRKLLLVIDNLDRVQPSDALSVWSTLQTFLGHSDYRQSDWLNRLWVLIPYDGNAILRLWDGEAGDATDATNSMLAASFLDKTFQVRFSVPPLLLTRLAWIHEGESRTSAP